MYYQMFLTVNNNVPTWMLASWSAGDVNLFIAWIKLLNKYIICNNRNLWL